LKSQPNIENARGILRTTFGGIRRICAHIIAESYGAATPTLAARALKDAAEGTRTLVEYLRTGSKNMYCVAIATVYAGDPTPFVKDAIDSRCLHTTESRDARRAYRIIRRQLTMASVRSSKVGAQVAEIQELGRQCLSPHWDYP